MCKLIKAGILRLRQNRIFWFMIAISIITSGIILYRENRWTEAVKAIDGILIRKCMGNWFFINSIYYNVCWNRVCR